MTLDAVWPRRHIVSTTLMQLLNGTRIHRLFPVAGVALSFVLVAAQAQDKYQMLQDDFPFQGACINAKFPAINIALKGLAIHVGNGE